MGSIGRRLERLEADKRRGAAGLSRETLGRMSDEDLDALEEALEVRQESGAATFEDLYRAVTERSRRTLDALLGVHEALSRGEEPPARDPPGGGALERMRRMSAGDEEAHREWERRNGYRIWKHYRK